MFAESLLTFFLVAFVAWAVTGKIYMGLILGALSSATAPAATYNVLGEYKARGPVTTTTLSIVALDDALALVIYGFASVFARSLIIHENVSLTRTLAMPLLHISTSVVTGILAGLILHKITAKTRDKDRMLLFSLGTIILVVGLSTFFKVDPISVNLPSL